METFSALLAICSGNSPASGEIPAQRPVTRRFVVFFDLFLNKRLREQSWGWWFETLSHPLWRHCYVVLGEVSYIYIYIYIYIYMGLTWSFLTTRNNMLSKTWWGTTPTAAGTTTANATATTTTTSTSTITTSSNDNDNIIIMIIMIIKTTAIHVYPWPASHSNLGLYSLSGRTSYRNIKWSREAARFICRLFQTLWNLTGTSTAALPRCLSILRAIRSW